MANLTPQTVTVVGTDLTMAAATASTGDTVPPGSDVYVKNGSGSAVTVTFTVPGNTKYGLANPDFTHSVPAGATSLFANLPSDLADPVTGLITFVCSAVTSVTVGAVTR